MYVEKLRNSIIENTKVEELEDITNLGMANSRTTKDLKKFRGMKMPSLTKKGKKNKTESRTNLQ